MFSSISGASILGIFALLAAVTAVILGAISISRLNSGFTTEGTITADELVTESLTTNSTCSPVLFYEDNSEVSLTNDVQVSGQKPSELISSSPIDDLSVGAISQGTVVPVTTKLEMVVQTQGVSVTSDGSQYVQLGEPEPNFLPGGGGNPPDMAYPGGSESSYVSFRVSDNVVTGESVSFRIIAETSNEPNFDFLTVVLNGQTVSSDSGAGPSSGDPFTAGSTPVVFLGEGDELEIRFDKDSIFYAGFDQARFRLENVESVSSVVLTMPTDLSEGVGKTYEICNNGTLSAILNSNGDFEWDSNAYWKTLLLQAPTEEQPCCVSFSITSETDVNVQSSTCTRRCAEGNLFHCVDLDDPEGSNPFHGNWQVISSGHSSLDNLETTASFVTIDTTKNPIEVDFIAGTVYSPREPNTYDKSRPTLEPCVGFSLKSIRTVDGNDIGSTNPPVLFTLQPNGDLREYPASTVWGRGQFPYLVLKKVDEIPELVPADKGTLDGDKLPDDPRSMIRYFAETMYLNGNPHARSGEDDAFIGLLESKALLDEIINDGVQFSMPVEDIFITQCPELITKIRTDDYHQVMAASKITVSGCTGGWSGFNGEHDVVLGQIWGDNVPDGDYIDWNADINLRSAHQEFSVWFDSSGFPADSEGVATSTGPCEYSVSYGPLTAASEYDTFISALHYYLREAYKTVLHAQFPIFFGPPPVTVSDIPLLPTRKTWAQIEADFDSDDETKTFFLPTRQVLKNDFWYTGMTERIISDLTFGSTPERQQSRLYLDVNNRFQVRPDVDISNPANPFRYHISRENYLVNVKSVTYTCTGTSKVGGIYNFAGLQYNGSPGCDTIVGELFDFDTIPPVGFSYLNQDANPNGGVFDPPYSTYDDDTLLSYKRMIFVGQINPDYTGGRSIGYIYVDAALFLDDFRFAGLSLFAPDFATGVRDGRESFNQILSAIGEYLVTDIGAEDVIIDNRGNLGGAALCVIGLRELFGTGSQRISSRTLNAQIFGVAESVPYEFDEEVPYTQSQDLINIAFSNESDANYPGTVFTGGDVILMTSTGSYSAGDLFPNYFLGTALDGELGGTTTGKIVGDIDGRLSGASCGNLIVPHSDEAPRFFEPDGQVFDPISGFAQDCGPGIWKRADGSSFHNRIPAIQPKCTPSLTGVSGGCPLPVGLEQTVYPDLGYTNNTRPRLTGDLRPQQPSPGDNSTWRDVWLEEAILEALSSPPVVKKRKRVPVRPKKQTPVTKEQRNAHISKSFGASSICSTLEGFVDHVPQNATYRLVIDASKYEKGTEKYFDDLDQQTSRIIPKFTSMLNDCISAGDVCFHPDTGKMMVKSTAKNVPVVRKARTKDEIKQ